MKIIRTDIFDIAVFGGGTAGFSAAVAAARYGKKVALIEKNTFLGGVATASGINQLLAGRKLDEKGEHVRVIGGIFDEFTDELIKEGNAIEPNTVDPNFNPFGWYPRMASGISCNETALKIKFDEFCVRAGVRIYYNTTAVDAEVENERIKSVVVFNKDGFVKIEADSFIDCTGDADIAHFAGCPYEKGRIEDGLTTPCSTEFHVENVDANELVTYQNEHQSPKLVEIIERLKSEGKWPFSAEIFVTVRLVEEDVFLINTLRQTQIDGVNEKSVTDALIQGRRDAVHLFEIMKEHFPGFKNARIRTVADHLGVRETRRITGRYTVSVDDALSGKKYDDTVAATTYNFDLPDPIKPSYDAMMGDVKKPHAERKYIVIRLPYRAMLPRGINNLIVAGRCVSVEREVMGAMRIIGPCFMMGQAAGTAASIAKAGDFTTVDIKTLQNTLWADGVLNPDELPFE